MRSRTPFAVLCMTPFLVSSVHAQFTPGHIFVSIQESEACNFSEDAIIEIDPSTGQWSIFADSADGICMTNGLRFTPDNGRLLCLNYNSPGTVSGSIIAFSPDGTPEVILDGSDGLASPSGGNGLAFDADGNLYVVDAAFFTVHQFPADGGSASVFADSGDGITGTGALDFAPNGDLFYIGRDAAGVIRITPEGVGSVFDLLPQGISLVFDRRGNLFVTAHANELGTTLYRYDNGDPSTRRILADGFDGFKNHGPITLSPDETKVYLVDQTFKVYAIDVNDGTTSVVADFSDFPFTFGIIPHGIAVYAPSVIPAVSPWGVAVTGALLLSSGIVVLRRRVRTISDIL